jgi:hypothetical protein
VYANELIDHELGAAADAWNAVFGISTNFAQSAGKAF